MKKWIISILALILVPLIIVNMNSKKVGLPTSSLSVTSGNLYHLDVFSPEMNDTINVDIWTPFGLPVGDAVAGQTELVFELTPFIDTLCGAAAGMTVQFILIATDAEDNEVLIAGETPVVTINVPA